MWKYAKLCENMWKYGYLASLPKILIMRIRIRLRVRVWVCDLCVYSVTMGFKRVTTFVGTKQSNY